MQFINPFQQFDPIKGELKGPFPIILNDMVKRARILIKGRTLDEIEFAVFTINYLLSRPESGADLKDDNKVNVLETVDLDKFISKFLKSQHESMQFSPARVLLNQIKDSNIFDQELFPKAKWEEYFAILALAAIGEMYWIYKKDREITIGTVGLAVEAMEALTIAEAPNLAIPTLDKSLRKEISLKNRESAILQHAELNAWKPKFHDWCDNVLLPRLGDEKPTRRGAARLYKKEVLDPLIEAGKAPGLKDQKDVVRTLAESLPEKFPAD